MRVVIHSQYYYPEIGAPQARLAALAKKLISQGHEVTVLTAMPNYPRGAIYGGYGGWVRREEIDGVKVIRSWIYATKSNAFIKRIFNYLSFTISSLIVGGVLLRSPTLVITESPPLFLGIAGILLSRVKRATWIFNVSDLWPESAVRLGVVRDGWILRMSILLEEYCYRNAWCVCGQSQEILENISSRLPEVRTYHLSNGADTEAFTPSSGTQYLRGEVGRGKIALFAGLHGLAQGLDQILLAAEALKESPDLKFVLIGDGPNKRDLMKYAQEAELTNVLFLDPLPHSKMPGILAEADFCIVPLGISIPGAVPSKLYEAMAAGRPALLMASGEAAGIVEKHGCGIVVEPGDISGLVEAIDKLATNDELRLRMGSNGRRAAVEHYDRTCISKAFVDFLEASHI